MWFSLSTSGRSRRCGLRASPALPSARGRCAAAACARLGRGSRLSVPPKSRRVDRLCTGRPRPRPLELVSPRRRRSLEPLCSSCRSVRGLRVPGSAVTSQNCVSAPRLPPVAARGSIGSASLELLLAGELLIGSVCLDLGRSGVAGRDSVKKRFSGAGARRRPRQKRFGCARAVDRRSALHCPRSRILRAGGPASRSSYRSKIRFSSPPGRVGRCGNCRSSRIALGFDPSTRDHLFRFRRGGAS